MRQEDSLERLGRRDSRWIRHKYGEYAGHPDGGLDGGAGLDRDEAGSVEILLEEGLENGGKHARIATVSPTPSKRAERESSPTYGLSRLYMAGIPPSSWIASWRERLFNLTSTSSFEYTAVEMNDRSVAEFHATEVQPRKISMQDMAGGIDIGGEGVEITNAKPIFIMEKEETSNSAASLSSFEDDEPTEEEKRTLRKVADRLPWSAYLVAMVELCERFTYYGLSGPFQNYIQNSYNDPSELPGAIGLGQTAATGLTDFFQFWCYVTPILGAIISDQYLGKYNTILYSSFVYLTGVLILFCTSLPTAIEHGAALGGLIVAMIVIGLGTGGIKSNVSPLIAEQYRGTKQTIRVEKNGERVIVDPGVTIQRIYMIFYLCINVGSLSSIATTEMEKHTGYWTAFLLCLCLFACGIVILFAGKRFYVLRAPRGSVIVHSFKAMWIGLKNKGNMEAAKPSYQEEYGRKDKTPWNDLFIDEVKRGLVACRVFVFYPIYWVVYSQMLNNFVSQAATMELYGIPNDIMQNIDAITIIIFIPIVDRIVYPGLRKIGIPFRPVTRITMGFVFAALSMAYAAIVQHLIYNAPPCYNAPLACPAANDSDPNKIHVAVQTPAYFLIGLSEIFASITGLEYAFTKAPPSMKSFVMSIFLLQSAFGSALGIALAPTAKDPKLVWMYTGLCIATIITAGLFWVLFKKYNATEETMNALEDKGEKAVAATEVGATGGHSHIAEAA
ncbi:peptide transporter ptr2 [Mycoblastus sanguinarius]|nr:peptide transporter ptr2 [Mycoblastus sanguinarius]